MTKALAPHEQRCYHCGLDIEETSPPELDVFGERRLFCCHGCKSVCEVIVDSGNQDYYQFRENPVANGSGAHLLELTEKLALYDKPEVQKDFVRHSSDGEEVWLILENIHCAACLWLNERHIRQLDGVLDCEIDYTSQQATVRWDPQQIKLSDILKAITQIGYIAHPFDPSHRLALQKEQKQRSVQRMIFALVLGMAVMNFSIASYFFGAPDANGEYPLWIRLARWTNLFTTALLIAYPGQLFFRNAFNDIKHRRFGMDTPVALGLSLAWLGSLKSTVTGHGEVYFESIAMFVVFLLIARYVELRARVDATALLDQTAKIIPRTVKRLENGNSVDTLVADLSPGDKIQLSAGETVPADACLVEPLASFDESLFSGESVPVQKSPGDFIAGGSVSFDQTVILEVKQTSANSTFSEIQQLARNSVNDKPRYVQLADQMAGKFIGVILSVATLTLLFWLFVNPTVALSHTIAVLIVTCPCALALAAPVALTLCSAGLAKNQILPVHLSAIEAMAKTNILILDKTGTLTTGTPVIRETLAIAEGDRNGLLKIAAAMESESEHPYAKAFISACPDSDLEVSNPVNYPGQGIQATVDGTVWRLGNESFAAAGDDWFNRAENTQSLTEWRQSGISVLYQGDGHKLHAIFLLTDPVRDHIKPFLAHAEHYGFDRILLLSGDHPESVQAIAESVGIVEAYGGLSPHDKLAFVQNIQKNGNAVMMFGDGINDAPVLASADVSLSFSDATDLATSHSDFVILRGDFKTLNQAFHLIQKTRRIIIENLIWAAGYNLLAIPAAAAGLVAPWMAAIGMTSSSLLVVINSLRLKRLANNRE